MENHHVLLRPQLIVATDPKTESRVISPVRPQDLRLLLSDARLAVGSKRASCATILLIDAEPSRLDSASRTLSASGYEVQTEASVEQVIDRLRTSQPDLILLTINVSDSDPFRVLRTIRQHHAESQLPVIISADATESHPSAATAFCEGASDFLSQPWEPEILLVRIRLQLRHRQAHADLRHSQESYALAAQGARIGLWDLDVARQQIFLSARWKELLGFGG